jgi:hypothetical protein
MINDKTREENNNGMRLLLLYGPTFHLISLGSIQEKAQLSIDCINDAFSLGMFNWLRWRMVNSNTTFNKITIFYNYLFEFK